MLYQTGKLVLKEIRTVRDNEDYKLSVCKDLNASMNNQYILTLVRNKSLKRDLLQCMEEESKKTAGKETPWVACFTEGQDLCYVFSYEEQRKMESFASAQLTKAQDWEQAALNLVVACMSSMLPYSLLYLLINEDNINLTLDNGIYLTNFFHLESFDMKVTQEDCVERCSNVVLKMLECAKSKRRKKLRSLSLIEKKVNHGAYKNFSEIYKDIKYCAIPLERKSFLKGWFAIIVENKDSIFRFLLVLSIVLFLIAMMMLISQAVFGDASFFKIGFSIEQIGTEAMNK